MTTSFILDEDYNIKRKIFVVFFAIEQTSHERLDQLLVKRFPAYSRAYFQNLIQQGSVKVNHQTVSKGRRLRQGDHIEVVFQKKQTINLIAQPLDLDVLYEDDTILCINKPAGLVVHPAPGHCDQTLVNALLYHCLDITLPGDKHRPGLVHRLDKETSGVLVIAKTPLAYEKLCYQFSSRQVKKRYAAIVIGHVQEKEICAPIGRHPKKRKQMAIVEGKLAKTVIQPIQEAGGFSLVFAYPITGRTHQIRVHLQHNQTPILGDPTYGLPKMNRRFGIERQLLHAERVLFEHPLTQKAVEIKAPLPEDMTLCLHEIFKLDRVPPLQLL